MIRTSVFNPESFADEAARRILAAIPERGTFVVTGGTTAERVYPMMIAAEREWTGVEVLFSDERCVPPDDPASNFGMVSRLLFEPLGITSVHRMQGELPPNEGARRYHDEIAPLVDEGLDLVLLGMGEDAHVGANFPGAPSLTDTAYCAAVDRPDGLKGLTLTPPALLNSARVILIVTGEAKAGAVARVLHGNESVEECPARLLAAHPNVTMLLDAPAAGRL